MKRLFFVFLICAILPVAIMAQNDRSKMSREDMEKERARIERLEKIKIVEMLNLNDETVLKFFARRNEFYTNTKYIFEEKKKLSDEFEADMKAGKKHSKRYYKGLIDKIFSLDREWQKKRENFYFSQSDILTTEQIAKLVVFQRRFNEWVINEGFKNDKPQK